ncbi:AMIN-like domain-containing (lipo)protein [Ornithinimicrobium pratense]|uniref:AMIN-like domain-containing (lipo)protein n=1 Tax=Ornithinimicrobium pratense TaxID=2593973 RepID=UPI003B5199AE
MLGGAVPAAAAVPTGAASASVGAAGISCGVTWGSLEKARSDSHVGDGTISNVRSGRHACFDRVVVDIAGIAAGKVGHRVRYVDTVTQPGSGQPVPLAGGARLQVDVTVPAYDSSGRPTYSPKDRSKVVDVTGYDTLRQVAVAGSFEGQTTFGVGVRARLPMRVFVLDGPGSGSRLVIDVAHKW